MHKVYFQLLPKLPITLMGALIIVLKALQTEFKLKYKF